MLYAMDFNEALMIGRATITDEEMGVTGDGEAIRLMDGSEKPCGAVTYQYS